MNQKYMTTEEKGYKSPNKEDCTQCNFYKDLCIVYGKTGKKNHRKWLQKQLKNNKKGAFRY